MTRNRHAGMDDTALPTQTSEPDSSWHQVGAGDRVVVHFPDGRSVQGRLDDLTGDLGAVWVVADGDRRRMLHPSDGLTVGPA